MTGARAVHPGPARPAARLSQRPARRLAQRQAPGARARLHGADRAAADAERHRRGLGLARGAAGAGARARRPRRSPRRCRSPAAASRRCQRRAPRRRRRDEARTGSGHRRSRRCCASSLLGSRRRSPWLNCAARRRPPRRRGDAPPPTPRCRARRVPRARRQLHRLPHRARRRAVCRRPGDRDAVRQRLRAQPHARRRDRPGPLVADEFWRALHHGRSRDGRLLYPAFPYPNYTRVARADADAMFAYLRSLAPVAQGEPAARAALSVRPAGRARGLARAVLPPGALRARPGRIADGTAAPTWSRRSATATPATRAATRSARPRGPLDLAGGLIPVQNWYAPSLTVAAEAGVADWPTPRSCSCSRPASRRAARSGADGRGGARSTQYLSDADLAAMATLPAPLPQRPARDRRRRGRATPRRASSAARSSTTTHCAACHGERRRRRAPAPIRRWPAAAR